MSDDYQTRLEKQKNQYRDGAEIHDLPRIFHYWSNKYLQPRFEEVLNCSTVRDFYANGFADLFATSAGRLKFVSIGSGDCSTEIEVSEALIARGLRNFEFKCLEVNDNLIREARGKIQAKGLTKHLTVLLFDINRHSLNVPVDGFMAHHSLHHILELEHLFDTIDACLVPNGRFLTMDMIGRNGHMRWPETLALVEMLWRLIDDSKKYNHQMRTHYLQFNNHDCSSEGFEGIRAQDIMPLLLSRFSFNAFFATGGIIEVFVDRGYGPNFDVNNQSDLRFIDLVEALNSNLLDLGAIKPTMLFADLGKKGLRSNPRIYQNRSPKFCLRIPS
jgi:hypothetical protein